MVEEAGRVRLSGLRRVRQSGLSPRSPASPPPGSAVAETISPCEATECGRTWALEAASQRQRSRPIRGSRGSSGVWVASPGGGNLSEPSRGRAVSGLQPVSGHNAQKARIAGCNSLVGCRSLFASLMLKIDTKAVEALARKLDIVRSKAIPFAVRQALNDQVFAARKRWQKEMGSEFIIRNRWTLGSIRVEKARGRSVQTMQSVVGSLAGYMHDQEFGGSHADSGIPTAPAAGQPMGQVPRTRTVRGPNKLSSKLRRRTGRSRKSRGKARLVYLETAKAKGIFKVWGRGKKGGRALLWDFGHPHISLSPKPTLGDTVDAIRARAPKYYARAFIKELRRAGWK